MQCPILRRLPTAGFNSICDWLSITSIMSQVTFDPVDFLTDLLHILAESVYVPPSHVSDPLSFETPWIISFNGQILSLEIR